MKGENLITGMISILVGAVLIFAVIVPILNNGTIGTLYDNEALTSTSNTSTTVNFTTSVAPLRPDKTYFACTNYTGVAIPNAEITLGTGGGTGNTGEFIWTNSTSKQRTNTTTQSITCDYRALDSAYIDNNISRTMATYIVPIVLVLLIVGLTAFIM